MWLVCGGGEGVGCYESENDGGGRDGSRGDGVCLLELWFGRREGGKLGALE